MRTSSSSTTSAGAWELQLLENRLLLAAAPHQVITRAELSRIAELESQQNHATSKPSTTISQPTQLNTSSPREPSRLRNIPAQLRPATILVVPGFMESAPRDLDAQVAVEFLKGGGLPPQRLELSPTAGGLESFISRIDALPGYTTGRNLFIAAYDWRLPLAPTDSNLNGLLNLNHINFNDRRYRFGVEYIAHWMQTAQRHWRKTYGDEDGFRVHIIGHDTGGLLARAFVQSDHFQSNYYGAVDRMITIGTPHSGFIQSMFQRQMSIADYLETWDVDESIVEVFDYIDLATDFLGVFAPGVLAFLPLAKLAGEAIGAGELLAGAAGNPLLEDLDADTDVLRTMVGQVITIGGSGLRTEAGISIKNGKLKTSFSLDGDGIVLALSSLLPGIGIGKLFDGVEHDKLLSDRRVVRAVIQELTL